jgi:hypothetical protein
VSDFLPRELRWWGFCQDQRGTGLVMPQEEERPAATLLKGSLLVSLRPSLTLGPLRRGEARHRRVGGKRASRPPPPFPAGIRSRIAGHSLRAIHEARRRGVLRS